MINKGELPRIASEFPTDEDLFFLEWGRETFKENVTIINETLKLFITLNSGLISVFIGFHKQIFSNPSPWDIITPAGLLIVSLIAAIVGVYPISQMVNLLSPDEIRDYKLRRSSFKRKALSVSAACLILSFLTLLYTVAVSVA